MILWENIQALSALHILISSKYNYNTHILSVFHLLNKLCSEGKRLECFSNQHIISKVIAVNVVF